MIPPLEQHRVADQLEPRCKFQLTILEHGLQFVLRHITCVLHFVRIGFVVDVSLDNEYVVDWRTLMSAQIIELGNRCR